MPDEVVKLSFFFQHRMYNFNLQPTDLKLELVDISTIHRTEKDGGCTGILPQIYLDNLTEPLAHVSSHILANFINVLTTSCMQSLKFSDLFCAPL